MSLHLHSCPSCFYLSILYFIDNVLQRTIIECLHYSLWSPIHPLFTCRKCVSLREPQYISLFDVPLLNKNQQLFIGLGCLAQSSLTGPLEHQIHQFAFAFSCCLLLIQIYLMKHKPNDWNCFSLSLSCFTAAHREEETGPQKSMPDSKIWAYFKWLEKLQHFTRESPYHAETAMKIRGKL